MQVGDHFMMSEHSIKTAAYRFDLILQIFFISRKSSCKKIIKVYCKCSAIVSFFMREIIKKL